MCFRQKLWLGELLNYQAAPDVKKDKIEFRHHRATEQNNNDGNKILLS
jgi:hypothetical protein